MIDNVILLITGTLHQRSIAELVPKCHPLGSFEQMEAVNIAQTPAELYNAILVDTPLGEPLSREQDAGCGVHASSTRVPPGGDPELAPNTCPLLHTLLLPSGSPILSSSPCCVLLLHPSLVFLPGQVGCSQSLPRPLGWFLSAQ